jgi:hypothetical protein
MCPQAKTAKSAWFFPLKGPEVIDFLCENAQPWALLDRTPSETEAANTMWSIKSGQIRARHFPDIPKAVEAALKT